MNTPASSTAGLFKLSARDLPPLREAAEELGQAFFVVDLSRARNVPGFIKAMARDLAFPEWFGGNLDALNDSLTDFSWRPAPGYVIVLAGSGTLKASPTAFAAMNEVLACAVDYWQGQSQPFRVFYLEDDTAKNPPHRVRA